MKRLRIPCESLKYCDSAHLVTASNTPMRNLGIVDLNVSIQGLAIPVQFCVLRELTFPCLLGANFLHDSMHELCTENTFII